MAKYKETIDLYDDTGKLLKSGVALEKISPVINPATRKIIDLTKRTVAVNLAGIQDGLKVGKVAKGHVLGRELNLDIVGNKDAVVSKIKEMVQVAEGDDTNIREFNGGKLILVEVPKVRLEAASTYDATMWRLPRSLPRRPLRSSTSSMSTRSTQRWSRRQSGVPTRTRWTFPAPTSRPFCRSPRTTRVSATHSATSRSTMSS